MPGVRGELLGWSWNRVIVVGTPVGGSLGSF